jgi:hypothetical protein
VVVVVLVVFLLLLPLLLLLLPLVRNAESRCRYRMKYFQKGRAWDKH